MKYWGREGHTKLSQISFVVSASDPRSWSFVCAANILGRLRRALSLTSGDLHGLLYNSFYFLHMGQQKS